MDNKLQQLENRIQELEKWKKEKEEQQISYPLDSDSITVLSKYFMRILEEITYISGAGGNTFTSYIGRQGNQSFEVSKNLLMTYSVDPSTDEFTVNSYLNDGTNVIILSSNTPPSPLVSGNDYYVINSTGSTFELSATLGGSAIDITDTGTGRQFIRVF